MIDTTAWGSVDITRDAAGYWSVLLQNEQLRVRYGHGLRFHRGVDMHESYIIEFVDRQTGEDQVQYKKNGFGWGCLDAGEWHGLIKEAAIVQFDGQRLTVHMEWEPIQGPVAVKEVTLYPGKPYLQIDYISWCVNIFDIGTPGGTTHGEYYLHGMDTWKRPLTFYPDIYFDRYEGDQGYQNITGSDQAGPLDDRGWFVMGIVNPQNGRGVGRIAPVETTDIIKLLFKDDTIGQRGFELFPYFDRQHGPYTSYLFTVKGGTHATQEIADKIVKQVDHPGG